MSTTTTNSASPPRISLMAAGELRDALTAIKEGKAPAAIAALMAIDPASWAAIEGRLTDVIGSDIRALLLNLAAEPQTLRDAQAAVG